MQSDIQNKKSKIEALTLDFFTQLTKLEEGFHFKVLDKLKISVLIQKYAKLVEYYDFHKDPIKNYFIDKIQFVLSRPDTIKSMVQQQVIPELIEEESESFQQKVPKLMTVSRAPSIAEQIERNNVLKGIELNENHTKTRGQQMNLTLQIQMLKKEQEPNLNKLMSDYKFEQEKMDSYIKSEMQIQSDVVQQKLEMRKKKLNNQSNRMFRTEASDDESPPKIPSFE